MRLVNVMIKLGNAEIHNANCMDLMKAYPDKYFELAIVDPPYGIDIAEWDTKDHIPTQEYFDELMRVSKNQIIWGGNYFNLPHTQSWICWDKTFKFNRNIDLSEFELAWNSFPNKAKFCRFTYCGNFYGWDSPRADYKKPPNIHPTQKPVEIYEWLLTNYAKQGDKILDTHLGSMSSVIAAHNLGFEIVGSELDKDYFDAGVERVKQAMQQVRLFA